MLEVGTKAPDFELFDQDGKLHKLNDYIGKKVILYFSSNFCANTVLPVCDAPAIKTIIL